MIANHARLQRVIAKLQHPEAVTLQERYNDLGKANRISVELLTRRCGTNFYVEGCLPKPGRERVAQPMLCSPEYVSIDNRLSVNMVHVC